MGASPRTETSTRPGRTCGGFVEVPHEQLAVVPAPCDGDAGLAPQGHGAVRAVLAPLAGHPGVLVVSLAVLVEDGESEWRRHDDVPHCDGRHMATLAQVLQSGEAPLGITPDPHVVVLAGDDGVPGGAELDAVHIGLAVGDLRCTIHRQVSGH